jgi:hypothetical protein
MARQRRVSVSEWGWQAVGPYPDMPTRLTVKYDEASLLRAYGSADKVRSERLSLGDDHRLAIAAAITRYLRRLGFTCVITRPITTDGWPDEIDLRVQFGRCRKSDSGFWVQCDCILSVSREELGVD